MALQRRRGPRPQPQSSLCEWRFLEPLPVQGPPHEGARGPQDCAVLGPLAIQGHAPGGTEGVCAMGGRGASCQGRSGPGCGGGRLAAPEPPLSPAPALQVFVVELLGRRILLLLGFSICFCACCVLTVALVLQVRGCGPHAPAPAAHCPLPAHFPVARGGTSC